MRDYILPTIAGSFIIGLVIWFGVSLLEVVNCDNYEFLTGTKTTMMKGKCYKYVDGQLQVVKELE